MVFRENGDFHGGAYTPDLNNIGRYCRENFDRNFCGCFGMLLRHCERYAIILKGNTITVGG